MPHFFIDSKNINKNTAVINDNENYRHIAKSLRARIGEKLLLIDETQIQYETIIKKIDSNLRISQSCHAYKELYEYLIKNKGKEFVFTVPENLVLADLKEFAQILSEKINGKNVFIWKIEK